MKAHERGRNLVIELGEPDDDNYRTITVPPLSAGVGADMYSLWLGLALGLCEDPNVDATNMGKLAVGEENWPIIDQELRWGEAERVIHVAFFWNVQGGGIDLVNTLLGQEGATGGYPKAQSDLLKRNGHLQRIEQLTTSLSSASATETPSPDGTSDTSTPSGSAT